MLDSAVSWSTVSLMKHASISKGGQVSIPAEVRHRCRTSAGIDTCPPFEMLACFMSDTVDHETALSSMSTLSNHAEVFGRPGNRPRGAGAARRVARKPFPAAHHRVVAEAQVPLARRRSRKGKTPARPLPTGPTGGRCEH